METLIHGDCLETLKTLPENSVDSIVTDPPYELGFMGKTWDNTGIANSKEMWREAMRVLKPGGHLLSFSGTRTYHRMATAIEDAGFEIRDMIEWVYGSGFPKSLNIGKAVDKINGETGRKEKFTEWMRTTGITAGEINKITNSFMGSHYLTAKEQPAIPTAEIWAKLRPYIKTEIPKWVDELIERIEREREVVGIQTNIANKNNDNTGRYNWNTENQERKDSIDITKGTSEWEGWGTALKPAHEPICMARKPLSEKTVAENCLKWGTGGINIDESRVESEDNLGRNNHKNPYGSERTWSVSKTPPQNNTENPPTGRFPANLITDGSEEVRECFPDTKSGKAKHNSEIERKGISSGGSSFNTETCGFDVNKCQGMANFGDSGNASRFFKSIIYQAKASKSERNAGCEELEEKRYSHDGRKKDIENPYQRNESVATNNHPTVKPIALMEYLIKMVTPEGGIVLDPFMGSGSTGVACKQNGYDFIGIDMTPEYVEIAKARINSVPVTLL